MHTNYSNLEAERYVLGSVLGYYSDVKDELDLIPLDYTESRHRHIIEAVLDLAKNGESVDVMMVDTWLTDHKKKVEGGGLDYLAELAGSVPTTANVKFYEKIIKKQTKKRELEKVALQIQRKLADLDEDEEIDKMASGAAKYMSSLIGVESQGFVHISEVMKDVLDTANQDRPEIVGIPSGYTELDRMTGGFKAGELVIIGARPSVGKTAFALGLASNAGGYGAIVPLYSLEMVNRSLGQRLLSSASNVNSRNIKIGNSALSDDSWNKLYHGAGELSERNILMNDKSGIDIYQIKKDLMQLRKENPESEIICFIDYLQLIKGDPIHKGNRVQEVSDITRTLKMTAIELNICIVALSQLSRGVEQRQDKRPMLSDIRESGSIEQDADVVAFLYRDDYYDKESENKNIIECIVAKQRDGAVGTVSLAFIKEYGKFVNIERRFDE